MALDIHKVIKLLIGSVLIGLLSGCGVFGLGGAVLTSTGPGVGELWSPPRVLCTTEDSIGVSYSTLWSDARHDEAAQLISNHCGGGYIETDRADFAGSHVIYATCLQADGSPAVSQPCEHVVDSQPIEDDADEHVGFGQEDVTIPDG